MVGGRLLWGACEGMCLWPSLGVEPGVELDSPETGQWVRDRSEAGRLSREARWQRVTPEGPSGEATESESELVELDGDHYG